MTEVDAPADVDRLAEALVAPWASWGPTLTHDADQLAYVSNRRASPEVWVQPLGDSGAAAALELSCDPVLAVRWSPDGAWIAASVATGGGVRSEVWVVRPDGTDGRRVAGNPGHAILGPWARRGHQLLVTLRDDGANPGGHCVLIDPDDGRSEPVVSGALAEVVDLSPDQRFALVRDGPRGEQSCRLVDRSTGRAEDALPFPTTGSAEVGLLRPSPPGDPSALVAYLVTDAGYGHRVLLAASFDHDGRRTAVGTLAYRDDAELEFADADEEGRLILLSWNVEGRSELELYHVVSGERRAFGDLPGAVVTGASLSRDGSRAILAVDGPLSPTRLWELEVVTGRWTPQTPSSAPGLDLVTPTLERFESHDGLSITGWLYRPAGADAGPPPPAVLSIHGGPESQERPGFHPDHQMLVASGIAVFAPNIRGSSGFGHTFVHADDRYGRFDAIEDVVACAAWLVANGHADPDRLALTGRSYGGYVTLMGLTHRPDLWAAGVDICGMSDLRTFYRDTEPWIARAAVTKYGDPARDADLLVRISPLGQAERIAAPLLVVHGELDTNVPLGEAHQIVARLRELGRAVEYLELAGEGHEYRRAASRRLLLTTVTRFLSRQLLDAS